MENSIGGSVQIKIVMRNKITGEEHITMAMENMARAFLGDSIIDEVIRKGKITNLTIGTANGTR